MEVVVTPGKEVHALTRDTCHVHAIDAREVHLAQCLSVHLGASDDDTLRHEVLYFVVLLVPFCLRLRADESLDGFGVSLGAHDEQFVAHLKGRLAGGDAYLAVVEQAGTYEVAVKELGQLAQGSSGDVGVFHTQVHVVGFGVRVCSIFLVQFLFLLGGVHLTDVLDEDSGTDDAHNTERVGTGVTVGDAGRTVGEYADQRLVGSTETRRVGNGTIERTYHHRQINGVAGVEEDKVTCEHDAHVQEDGCCGEQVERNAALLEALEEARTYLQTYHEDKEDKSEVLYEGEYFLGSRKTYMPSQNAGKEHKGYS